MEVFLDRSPLNSLEVTVCAGFFECPLPIRVSLLGGSTISPSSISAELLPPGPLFLFLSPTSAGGVQVPTDVTGRRGTTTIGEEPQHGLVTEKGGLVLFLENPCYLKRGRQKCQEHLRGKRLRSLFWLLRNDRARELFLSPRPREQLGDPKNRGVQLPKVLEAERLEFLPEEVLSTGSQALTRQ